MISLAVLGLVAQTAIIWLLLLLLDHLRERHRNEMLIHQQQVQILAALGRFRAPLTPPSSEETT